MVSLTPFFVNVGFDDYVKYPDNGFLKYPYALLKTVGVKTRFWASYWAMSNAPKPIYSPAPLAACGCMPAKTIKKQIAELVREQVLLPWATERGIEYRPTREMSQAVALAYSNGQPFVKVPRTWFHYWPDMTFTETLLLGLYHYKLHGQGFDRLYPHPCKFTMQEIQSCLGFDVRTWRRAADSLQQRGLIVRERNSRGYAVTLPQ